MDKNQLLAEIEWLLREAPLVIEFGGRPRVDDELEWIGRVAAALERWDPGGHYTSVNVAATEAQSLGEQTSRKGLTTLKRLLYQAAAGLRMDLGQLSVLVAQGEVFHYFDELRKLIESARSEVFFVDAYLDADFVPRYLPHVASGVSIRLLSGTKKLATLLPAVDMFAKQHGVTINVRSSGSLHDRYLFVDQAECYLSGASFKDGAKNAPAVVTKITDGFQALWKTYDDVWVSAKVER